MSNETGTTAGRSGWVIFGYCATAIYLGAFGSGVAIRSGEFLAEFQLLPLNALGDFIAGFAAPLAFLWLFVATMVQSQELALQREELRLTREEMEFARAVAKETAGTLAQQTDLAIQRSIDDEIRYRVEAVLRAAQSMHGKYHHTLPGDRVVEIFSPFDGIIPSDLDLADLGPRLSRLLSGFDGEPLPYRRPHTADAALGRMFKHLFRIKELSGKASEKQRSYLDDAGLDKIIADAQSLEVRFANISQRPINEAAGHIPGFTDV